MQVIDQKSHPAGNISRRVKINLNDQLEILFARVYRTRGRPQEYLVVIHKDIFMAVSISCPQLVDAAVRTQLAESVKTVIKRWRPSFENWRLSLFKSQSGQGWDLAISGPRFRKIFTLYGPADDLPGLVTAYIDAILAQKNAT
jgi:hypothetical protein